MLYHTHLAGGMTTATLLYMFVQRAYPELTFTNTTLYFGAISCLVGSVAPDIDLPTSKAAKSIGPASKVLSFFFGHRTFFHSPLIVVLLYFALNYFFPQYSIYTIAFLAGYCSHLFLDMFNKTGIPLLYPRKKRYHIASIKTGSRGETVISIALFFVSTISIIHQIT